MTRLSAEAARKLGIEVPPRKTKNRHPAAGVSHLEELLAHQLDAAGLPEPEREVVFSPRRDFRADFLWGDPFYLIVEVQGGTKWGQSRHSKGEGFRNDCEKAAEAVLCGYHLVPVTSDQVRNGWACETIAELLEKLSEGGW